MKSLVKKLIKDCPVAHHDLVGQNSFVPQYLQVQQHEHTKTDMSQTNVTHRQLLAGQYNDEKLAYEKLA